MGILIVLVIAGSIGVIAGCIAAINMKSKQWSSFDE
ncbi:hypothetical protein MMC2321_05075 [Chitinophaga sp. MM2321]